MCTVDFAYGDNAQEMNCSYNTSKFPCVLHFPVNGFYDKYITVNFPVDPWADTKSPTEEATAEQYANGK